MRRARERALKNKQNKTKKAAGTPINTQVDSRPGLIMLATLLHAA